MPEFNNYLTIENLDHLNDSGLAIVLVGMICPPKKPKPLKKRYKIWIISINQSWQDLIKKPTNFVAFFIPACLNHG